MDVLEYIITMPTAGRLTVTAPRGMAAIDYDVAVTNQMRLEIDRLRAEVSRLKSAFPESAIILPNFC